MPAFLLSCFPAFLLSCFPAFLLALVTLFTVLGPQDASAQNCARVPMGGVANNLRDNTGTKDCLVLEADNRTAELLFTSDLTYTDPDYELWEDTTARSKTGKQIDASFEAVYDGAGPLPPYELEIRLFTLENVNLDPKNMRLKFPENENIALTLENASMLVKLQPVWPANSQLTLAAVSGDNIIEKLSGNVDSPTTLTVADATSLQFFGCGSVAPSGSPSTRCNFKGFPNSAAIEGLLELKESWVIFNTTADEQMRVFNGGKILLSTSSSVLETDYLDVDDGSIEMAGSTLSVEDITLNKASVLTDGSARILVSRGMEIGAAGSTITLGTDSRVIVNGTLLSSGDLTIGGKGTVVTTILALLGTVGITESTSLVITGDSNTWNNPQTSIDIDPKANLTIQPGGDVFSSIPIRNDGTLRVEGSFKPLGEMTGDGVLQVDTQGTLGPFGIQSNGTFTASPRVDMNALSTFKVQIDPTAGQAQKLIASTSFSLSTLLGVYLEPDISNDRVLTPGTQFVIVEYPQGNVVGGHFIRPDNSPLKDGGTFTAGLNTYRINYNSTNITLTVVDTSAGHAIDDYYKALQDQTLTVPAPGVLGNDVNVSGTPTVVDQPMHGTVNLNPDGSFTYVPAAGFTGNDSFTYQVDNSNVATVFIHVRVQDDCTLSQGYWTKHSGLGGPQLDTTWLALPQGPATPFFMSGGSYLDALSAEPEGNPYYILSQQYVATELNFLRGADPSSVQPQFDQATMLFEQYKPEDVAGLDSSDPTYQWFISLASTLDGYNNGLFGPGHCSD